MSINVNSTPLGGTKSIADGSTYGGANKVTLVNPAYYLKITETAGHPVSCKLNGLSTAVIPIPANGTLEFPVGAAVISTFDFANSSGSAASVTYVAGVGNF